MSKYKYPIDEEQACAMRRHLAGAEPDYVPMIRFKERGRELLHDESDWLAYAFKGAGGEKVRELTVSTRAVPFAGYSFQLPAMWTTLMYETGLWRGYQPNMNPRESGLFPLQPCVVLHAGHYRQGKGRSKDRWKLERVAVLQWDSHRCRMYVRRWERGLHAFGLTFLTDGEEATVNEYAERHAAGLLGVNL